MVASCEDEFSRGWILVNDALQVGEDIRGSLDFIQNGTPGHLFEEAREDVQSDNQSAQQEPGKEAKGTGISKQVIGYALLVGTGIMVAVSTACAQALGGVIPAFELNMWRYIPQVMLGTPYLMVKCCPQRPERGQMLWLTIVCLAFCIFNVLLPYF